MKTLSEGEKMGDNTPKRTMGRKGRPRKVKAEEASTRIIDTATRLFASQGFAGTSIEQVASECGAGKDTIYRRFSSKVALFEGVVEHARLKALNKLNALKIPKGSAQVRLKALLYNYLIINMEPDLIAMKRIAISEAVLVRKNNHSQSQPDPIMDKLIAAVETAQKDGYLITGDTSLMAAHLIHSLVSIPTTNAMLCGNEYDCAETLEVHFNTTWQWLVEGVQTKLPEEL